MVSSAVGMKSVLTSAPSQQVVLAGYKSSFRASDLEAKGNYTSEKARIDVVAE